MEEIKPSSGATKLPTTVQRPPRTPVDPEDRETSEDPKASEDSERKTLAEEDQGLPVAHSQ